VAPAGSEELTRPNDKTLTIKKASNPLLATKPLGDWKK
jgi:hypothetical protein